MILFLKINNPKIKQFSNINQMLRKCDAVNICIHLNKNNYHFFDKKKLNQLKKNCILINTSRGEIIDEKNLVKLIKSNKIKFYSTDVVSQEHKLPLTKVKFLIFLIMIMFILHLIWLVLLMSLKK